MDELPQLWGGYAAGQVRLQSEDVLRAAHREGLLQLLEKWDSSIPLPSRDWIACEPDIEAGISEQQRQEQRTSAWTERRAKFADAVEKLKS
jgi:hypothetical protein